MPTSPLNPLAAGPGADGLVPPQGRVAALANGEDMSGAVARPSQRRSRTVGGRETELKVRLSEGEKAALRVKASECGITMSRLMVESALAEVRNVSERAALDAELRDLRWLAGNLANNVNQLAHRANLAGQVRSVDRLERALEDLDGLRQGVDALVARLG